MSQTTRLRIEDLVGGTIWVSTDDGQKVYKALSAALKDGCNVELSFENRQYLISAFVNAAIGQLYNGDFSEDTIKTHLSLVDIDEDDHDMVLRSIDNAKKYFSKREAYDAAWENKVEPLSTEDEDEE